MQARDDLGLDEAATFLRVGEQWLRRRIAGEEIRAFKRAGRWRIPIAELDRFDRESREWNRHATPIEKPARNA